jgi:uncharacterized protein YqjF (DUF2071 family)
MSDFDASIVHQVAHRPWEMPSAPWVMTQTWNDLLFAHWPVPRGELRAKVPEEFDLDLFDGNAWVGLVPFHMSNVGLRGVPSLPGTSAFPELNVRTYVRVDDRPGVFFFSLDAASSLAVKAARTVLNLPYYSASMDVGHSAHTIDYQSRRIGSEPADLCATYRPIGPPFEPIRGTLEYFLTERYCLYNRHHNGKAYRLEIHHPPWPLQSAEGQIISNTMLEANGLTRRTTPPLLHFAKRQDVVAWAPSSLN